MNVLSRLFGRVKALLDRILAERGEAGVVESACCLPEHLVPPDDAPGGGSRSDD